LPEIVKEIFQNLKRKEEKIVKKTMSIHQALSELKTYEDRISRVLKDPFVVINRKGNVKIGGDTIEECKTKMKASLQSILALIENKKRIRAAVVKSNGMTVVAVGGKEYTVSEAIERKNMIVLEDRLVTSLSEQFTTALAKVEAINEALPQKLDSYLQSVLGDKGKADPENIAELTKNFRATNEYELVDPNSLGKRIKEMYDEISEFKGEVDYKLSESNATTFIEVDLVD
jgi:hypothetical protein